MDLFRSFFPFSYVISINMASQFLNKVKCQSLQVVLFIRLVPRSFCLYLAIICRLDLIVLFCVWDEHGFCLIFFVRFFGKPVCYSWCSWWSSVQVWMIVVSIKQRSRHHIFTLHVTISNKWDTGVSLVQGFWGACVTNLVEQFSEQKQRRCDGLSY